MKVLTAFKTDNMCTNVLDFSGEIRKAFLHRGKMGTITLSTFTPLSP